MKKADLVDIVSEKMDMTKKDSAATIDLIFNEITNALAEGDKVSLVGFGTFSVRDRAGRVGINPAKKGEKVVIPPTRVPAFKAGKVLKESVK